MEKMVDQMFSRGKQDGRVKTLGNPMEVNLEPGKGDEHILDWKGCGEIWQYCLQHLIYCDENPFPLT